MPSRDESVETSLHTMYRCTECGALSLSLGKLHAHAEKHRGTFLGLQLPWKVGDPNELMEYTEIIELEEKERHTGDDAREYLGRFKVVENV